jgi:hypothetical protein
MKMAIIKIASMKIAVIKIASMKMPAAHTARMRLPGMSPCTMRLQHNRRKNCDNQDQNTSSKQGWRQDA